MSYSFNATHNISSADNAVSGIDVANFSMAAFVKMAAQPSTDNVIVNHCTQAGLTSFCRNFAAIAPSTSGFRIQVAQGFDAFTAAGAWATSDLVVGNWYHIGWDYNNNPAQTPKIYVNGLSVSMTQTAAPGTTAVSGDDTLRIGVYTDATLGLVGKVEHIAFWNRRLTADEWLTMAIHGPLAVPSGRVYWIPLRVDAVEMDGKTGALTVTGATLVASDNAPIASMASKIGMYSSYNQLGM